MNKNLTHIDYEILKFISKFDKVHLNDILEKFPDDKYSTKLAIKKLSSFDETIPFENILNFDEHTYISRVYKDYDIDNPQNLETDFYYLTVKGKYILNEYLKQKNIKNKDTILQIAPIIISFIALLKSFDKELICILQLLMRLLK